MKRRSFLTQAGTILTGAASYSAVTNAADQHTPADTTDTVTATVNNYISTPWQVPVLSPIHASPDRVISMNLCTRPFRAMGPRQELERINRKNVIHNYGHGGSGWSLSWGSADLVTDMALETGETTIAVIGCGALGMTTAVMAQRKGLKVTIYASEIPPFVRSSFATGVWSPDSRICTQHYADTFAASWEKQARFSHNMFQNLLGVPGHPVEWKDIYQ